MTHVIPAPLLAKLQSASHRQAHLVKLTLASGTVIALTDWDQALTVNLDGLGAIAYSPANIESVSAFAAQLSAAIDDAELVVAIDGADFTADKARTGAYAAATVKVGVLDPDVAAESFVHRAYDVGQARVEGVRIRFELIGVEKRLEQPKGRTLTVNCPWSFTDANCGIAADVAAWAPSTAYALGAERKPTAGGLAWFRVTTAGTSGGSEPTWPAYPGTVVDGTVTWTAFRARKATGTVSSVTDSRQFGATGLNIAVDHFGEGLLTWLTGSNAGVTARIRSDNGAGGLVIHMPAFSTIQVGDTFSALAGCRKRLAEDCTGKHANALASSSKTLRFGGFPFLAPEDGTMTLEAD